MAGQVTIDLGSKSVPLERALASIRPGSRIYLGTGCAAPRSLLARLEEVQPGPADLEFVSFVTTSALLMNAGAPQTRYRHRTFFVGVDACVVTGRRKTPLRPHRQPGLFAWGRSVSRLCWPPRKFRRKARHAF